MKVLGTDHATTLHSEDSVRRRNLISRMALSPDATFGVSVPTVEEELRGWLATIAKERKVSRQIKPFERLQSLIKFFAVFTTLPFDNAAAAHFDRLRPVVPRLGTMDLKIAFCALAADATLLTANRRDFEKVPGLKFENWLD